MALRTLLAVLPVEEAAVRVHDAALIEHTKETRPKVLLPTDSGDLIRWWLVTTTLCCVGFVLLATFGAFRFRKILTYWNHEASRVGRVYMQKLAIFNLANLCWLYLLYLFVFRRSSTGEPEAANPICFKLGAHSLLTLTIFGIALIAGLVRYLAVGFAHSETHNVRGKEVFNPSKQHVRKGFNASTSNLYSQVISPYIVVGGIMFTAVTVYLYGPIADKYRSPVLDKSLCLAGWPEGEEGFDRVDAEKIIVVLSFVFQPLVCVMLVENWYFIWTHGVYDTDVVPGYYYIMNSPFVMVTLTTTWTTWLGVLLLVYLTTWNADGGEFLVLMMFFLMLDSLFLTVVCIITGRKNKVTTM